MVRCDCELVVGNMDGPIKPTAVPKGRAERAPIRKGALVPYESSFRE